MTYPYSEIFINDQPDKALLRTLSSRIVTEFNAEMIGEINDFDSIYCDFQVGTEIITLHLNTFTGISIFPKYLNNARLEANQLAEKIGFKLKYSNTHERNWVVFKSGTEIEIQFLLALILDARQGKEKYIQQKFSDSAFATNEHKDCTICLLTISGNETAYFKEDYGVCKDCFKEFIEADDYLKRIEKLDKIVKKIN